MSNWIWSWNPLYKHEVRISPKGHPFVITVHEIMGCTSSEEQHGSCIVFSPNFIILEKVSLRHPSKNYSVTVTANKTTSGCDGDTGVWVDFVCFSLTTLRWEFNILVTRKAKIAWLWRWLYSFFSHFKRHPILSYHKSEDKTWNRNDHMDHNVLLIWTV